MNLNQEIRLGEKESNVILFFREINFLTYASHYRMKSPSVKIFFLYFKDLSFNAQRNRC